MDEEGCGSLEDEKEEAGEWGRFEGWGRGRDGSDGRRVVMEELISTVRVYRGSRGLQGVQVSAQ